MYKSVQMCGWCEISLWHQVRNIHIHFSALQKVTTWLFSPVLRCGELVIFDVICLRETTNETWAVA
jgi:hypothetical protein